MSGQIKISVVIPCRNEERFIRECVEAIYAAYLPENVALEVFIVDGMSDDNTPAIISELTSEFNTCHLVENRQQLTPYAFNLGIHAGNKPDFIQIIGARHIISRNYLSKCLETLQTNPEIWCVGGRLINEYINKAGETISKAMDTAFGMGIGNFRVLEKSGFTDTVTSPMYPYGVFEKIGFFDEELIRNQDDDFNYRVTKAGGKIWFEHSIFLKYYVRGNIKGLYKQFFQYGYWKVFVNRKHKAVTTMRQMVPPLFVLFLICSPFSILGGKYLVIPTAFVLAFYCMLCFLFGFKKGGNLQQKFQIAGVFPVLHLGYGLGYLKGMIHFLLLNKKPSDKAKVMTR